jgi:ethanolamine ammonia-lyase large subunit
MRETPKAAAAFEEYAAMGPSRSLRKLAEKHSESTAKAQQISRQLAEWSSAHRWQERVRRYDADRIEEQRVKKDAAIEAMNEVQATLGQERTLKAIEQMDALIEARKFGSQATVQLFKVATDLERVARGAPTEHIEQSNANSAAEWNAIRVVIMQTLSAFPDARIAVAEALAQMEA